MSSMRLASFAVPTRISHNGWGANDAGEEEAREGGGRWDPEGNESDGDEANVITCAAALGGTQEENDDDDDDGDGGDGDGELASDDCFVLTASPAATAGASAVS